MATQFTIIQWQENRDRKIKLPRVCLCGSHFVCHQAFLSNSTVLFVVFASFKLLAAYRSPKSLVVKNNATGLCCSGVKYERHKIHAKHLFFLLDNYRSCWFVHAFSGFVSPSLRILCSTSQVGNQNVLGTISQHLWLGFFPPTHILSGALFQ